MPIVHTANSMSSNLLRHSIMHPVHLQVDLGRINALIAQNAGLKAMLEEEHLQLEVRGSGTDAGAGLGSAGGDCAGTTARALLNWGVVGAVVTTLCMSRLRMQKVSCKPICLPQSLTHLCLLVLCRRVGPCLSCAPLRKRLLRWSAPSRRAPWPSGSCWMT